MTTTPTDPLARLRPRRRAVDATRAEYRRARSGAHEAVGHLLRMWPKFPRHTFRAAAGGGLRFHYTLMSGHDQVGDEEIPLWEGSEEERLGAYDRAVTAVAGCLAAKRAMDEAVANRQTAVAEARSQTRHSLPLKALVEPSGLSYQWLLKLDHR